MPYYPVHLVDRLGPVPDVVRPQVDLEPLDVRLGVTGHAVSGGEDVVLVDDGASAELANVALIVLRHESGLQQGKGWLC